jgi:penicillin-binding protein 1B
MTFASMGARPHLSFVRKVTDFEGKEIFVHDLTPEASVDPVAVAGLVSMMKQTIQSGTARSVVLNGFTHPAAGKTGTTSDNRDAWFSGFTPYLTTIVWVGYDNNLPHKLTGANGAIPVWTAVMKKLGTQYPADDFEWPEGTTKVTLDQKNLEALRAIQSPIDLPQVELIFRKGTEP